MGPRNLLPATERSTLSSEGSLDRGMSPIVSGFQWDKGQLMNIHAKAAVAGSILATAMMMGIPAAGAGTPPADANQKIVDNAPCEARQNMPFYEGLLCPLLP